MADYNLNGRGGYNGTDFRPRIPNLNQEDMPNASILSLGNSLNGIGAFVQAAVIKVTGYASSIEVAIDRPLIYNGDMQQTPPEARYTIGTPTLDEATNRKLTVPVNVPLAPRPTVVPETSNEHQIVWAVDISSASDIVMTVTPIDGGVNASVLSATLTDARTLTITTTELTQGAQYRVDIPEGKVVSSEGTASVAQSYTFTAGAQATPTIVSARVIDHFAFELKWSEDMDPVTLGDVTRYSVAPSRRIRDVVVIDSRTVLLNLAEGMQPSVIYTVSSSARDRALNPG